MTRQSDGSDPISWGLFKEIVESHGVTDDDALFFIDYMSPYEIKVYRRGNGVVLTDNNQESFVDAVMEFHPPEPDDTQLDFTLVREQDKPGVNMAPLVDALTDLKSSIKDW